MSIPGTIPETRRPVGLVARLERRLGETGILLLFLATKSWLRVSIVLLAVPFSLVALAATALSWRVGRNWVGALAGAVPFVVVLYFFFENVNRLLPPNL